MYVKTHLANKSSFSIPIQSPIKNDTEKSLVIFSKSHGIRQLAKNLKCANWRPAVPSLMAQPPLSARSPNHVVLRYVGGPVVAIPPA